MNSTMCRDLGRILVVLAVFAMAVAVGINPAGAQNYPTKQIEMVAWA